MPEPGLTGAPAPGEPRRARRREPRRAIGREDGRSRLWRAFARPPRGQAVVACCWPWWASPGSPRCAPTTSTTPTPGCASRTSSTSSTAWPAPPSAPRPRSSAWRRPATTCVRHQRPRRPRSSGPQQVEVLSILAGTVPVPGPGVTIAIEEGSGEVRVGPFLDMVQALRTAGAEAMQINDEVRVVAQTSFEAARRRPLRRRPAPRGAVHPRRDRPPRQPGRRPAVPRRAAGPVRRGRRRADLRGGADRRRRDGPDPVGLTWPEAQQ